MERLRWIDPENFNAGYVMRNLHLLPKQGTARRGSTSRTTRRTAKSSPLVDLDDGSLVYK